MSASAGACLVHGYVRDATERMKAKLVFLPRYSPDSKSTENAVSKLKVMLRAQAERKIDAL
jgi:transposase